MTDDTQPEALRALAEAAKWTGKWYDAGCNTVYCTYDKEDSSQHDEIAHPVPFGVSGYIAAAHPQAVIALLDRIAVLESELEAVGAGGVSGPLVGRAAPPTAQAEGWTKLPGQLPEPGMPVLLDIGKKYPIRAMWAAKHTVQAADDDTDWGEYVEADDMYYAPEGWYEWNQCEDNHWRVTETPRAWMPLPPTSAEGVEHG